MKLLVLALCVYAASAATFTQRGSSGFKPTFSQTAKPSFTVSQPTYKKPTFPSPQPSFKPEVFKSAVTAAPEVVAYTEEPVYKSTPLYQPSYEPTQYKTVNKASYQGKESEAEVLSFDNEVNDNGFNYKFETGNGIVAGARGSLKNVDKVQVVAVEGQYEYPGPDGQRILVTYTADEDGFHPNSPYIPTPPPMPDHVLRLLKFLEEHHHTDEEIQSGKY